MANKKLVVTVSHDIEIPKNVKVISNGEWVTLAKKVGDTVSVLTMKSELIQTEHIWEEESWTDFTKDELKKLAAL